MKSLGWAAVFFKSPQNNDMNDRGTGEAPCIGSFGSIEKESVQADFV